MQISMGETIDFLGGCFVESSLYSKQKFDFTLIPIIGVLHE